MRIHWFCRKEKSMRYPTLNEVELASRVQLCKWHRFLPAPGESAVGNKDFKGTLDREIEVMNRIEERFDEAGGFTPAISKQIGWD